MKHSRGFPNPAGKVAFSVTTVGHDAAQIGELISLVLSHHQEKVIIVLVDKSNPHDCLLCTYAESDFCRLPFQTHITESQLSISVSP